MLKNWQNDRPTTQRSGQRPKKGQRVQIIQSPKTTATKEALPAIYNGKDFIPPAPTVFADYELGQSKWSDVIFWSPMLEIPKEMFE